MSDSDTDHDQEMRDMETQELLSEYERLSKRLYACVEEADFRLEDDVIDSIKNKSNKMPVRDEDLPGGVSELDRLRVAVRHVSDAADSDE